MFPFPQSICHFVIFCPGVFGPDLHQPSKQEYENWSNLKPSRAAEKIWYHADPVGPPAGQQGCGACFWAGWWKKNPAIVSRLVYRSEKTGLSLLTYLPYTYNLGLWLLISDLLNGVRHQLGLFFLVASFIFIKADFQRVLPPQTSSKLLKPMGSRVSLTLEYIYKVLQCGAPQL